MMDYESAKKGIRASLEKSGLEYFDLYLLHQACGDYFSAWRAMEDAYKKGLLKASVFLTSIQIFLQTSVKLLK